MSEEKKVVAEEIKEIAKRIEDTLYDYRVRYYLETPYNSKRRIYHNLEQANIHVTKLLFANRINEDKFHNEILRVKEKYTFASIYISLENAVNENLKYYNLDVAKMIVSEINRISDKLKSININICDHSEKFILLNRKLDIANNFFSISSSCPGLRKINDTLIKIEDIPYFIHLGELKLIELYGIKTLFLELENNLKSLDGIKCKSSTFNIVLDCIDDRIDINRYETIYL